MTVDDLQFIMDKMATVRRQWPRVREVSWAFLPAQCRGHIVMLAAKFVRSRIRKFPGCAVAFGLMTMAVALPGSPARAAGNLVTNGGFESVGSNTQSYQVLNSNPLPGWTEANQTGIDCVVVGGVNNMCGTGYSGPAGYSPATFALFPGVSPAGGNFFAGDSALTYEDAISQTISGLVSGKQYSLTFYQAGAQQAGYSGATTDEWQVTFGTSTQTSTLMNVPSGGDAAWNSQSMIFTATAASEVLTFLAVGTPNSDPPFALLDGVSMTQVPEPASITLMGVGILGLAGLRRRRGRRQA